MVKNVVPISTRIGFAIIFSSIHLLGQSPGVKQDAKNSPCSNIVAVAGNASVNCSSLTPQQRRIIEGIPSVLNKILANQLDPDAVMTKLDEILRAVNPNLPAKTYFCNGQWRTAGPGANAGLEINMGGNDTAFKEMIRLNNSREYTNFSERVSTKSNPAQSG